MADKNLQSITFPGLTDRYVVPQVDNTLTQAGRPADAKKTGDEITELKADLTAIETDIESGDLTAGTAEQLLADTGLTDKSPYLFRAMPTGAGDREEPVIVGGSVVHNQYLDKAKWPATKTENGVTFTNNGDGSITVNGTATATTTFVYPDYAYSFAVKDHIYLVSTGVKETGSSTSFELMIVGFKQNEANLNLYAPATVAKHGGLGTTIQIAVRSGATVSNLKFAPQITDLTAEFGTTIADYVYSLEQATAGAGIAWLKKYGYFTQPYYPFCEPTFKHVEGLVSHKMTGFNQWDGKCTANAWFNSNSTGAIAGVNGYNLTGYIPVIPGKTYYHSDTGSQRSLYFDTNKSLVGAGSWSNAGQNPSTFVVPEGVRYIRFTVTNANIANFIINLSDPAKNGTYEPYKAHTYPLDTDVVLRGIPKLDASNNLYFDGDVYKADGTVTRRYGIVDLGTLTWNTTLSNRASVTIPNMKIPTQSSEIVPILSENGYTQIAPSGLLTQIGQFALLMDRQLLFYYDGNTLPSGEIVYELTTPTTETADPYAPLQLADPYGTEEWVLDDDAFPMPVGQETFYPENLRAKIEGLPWNFANLIAPTEVSYTATRNYTAGNLLIVDNVLYKVTVNIANGGTITPGTNVVATTLAEIISALQ